MLWRKYKLDWQYATGELIIVTAGVLIALWIQQWNDARLERLEEKEILTHLLIDLDADKEALRFLTTISTRKHETLRRLNQTFSSNEEPVDGRQFLVDIVSGAELGWFQQGARRNTFDEIVSSGKLGLIRRSAVREELSHYYAEFESLIGRTDARESDFPKLAYALIPRETNTRFEGDTFLGISDELSPQEVDQLVDMVWASPIRNQVVGEMNVARFILLWATDMESDRAALVSSIQEYLDSLG